MTEALQSTKKTPGDSSLGTTAKSSLHHGSGEGQRKAHRALKYQALSQGRQWLVRQAKAENPDAMPGDVYRTADCRYVNHSAIGVNISPVHKAAHYSGLVTCGSIWPCPVCASRIQERRRPECSRRLTGPRGRATRSLWSRSPFRTSPGRAWAICWRQADAFKRLRKG